MQGTHSVSSCCLSITVSGPSHSSVARLLTGVHYSRNIPGDLVRFVCFAAFQGRPIFYEARDHRGNRGTIAL